MIYTGFSCVLVLTVLLVPAFVSAAPCDAHYPFDGSLDDVGGNGLHGQLLDKNNMSAVGARFETGIAGQALRIGNGRFVRTPLNLQTTGCPQVTITAWIFLETGDATPRTIVSTGFGNGPRLETAGHSLSAYGASNKISAGQSVRPGNWMFIAGTWDFEAGRHRLYWNNRFIEEPLGKDTRPPQEHFWIGANGYLEAVHYIANGTLIDDVRVYGRLLAPIEIANVQREHAQRAVAPVPVDMTAKAFSQGTICDAHYPLNGNLLDTSANGYHARTISIGDDASGEFEFVPGRHGQAIRLDGASALIAPFDLHYSLCPRVTVTAWVYFEDEPSGERTILSTGFGSGPRLSAVSGSLKGYGGGNAMSRKDVFEQGRWTFVVGTWDFPAGVLRLTTDAGTIEEPLGEYSRPPQQELWLGVYAYNQSLMWQASNIRLDDVRIYGRIVDSQELAIIATTAPDDRYALPERTSSGSDASGGAGIGQPAEDGHSEPATIAGIEESVLAVRERDAGVIDPELTPPDNLPVAPPTNSEEWQDAAWTEYQRQQNEEFENSFGPRNRTQVVVGQNGSLAFAGQRRNLIEGPDAPRKIGVDLDNMVLGEIRELLRLKGTEAVMRINDQGTVSIQGNPEGRHSDLIRSIDGITARQRPVDLVAEGDGAFLIVSGTEVVSSGMPQMALAWAESQLRLRARITAFAFLGGGAWIGVSERGISTAGMTAGHYGIALRQKATELLQAGDRIEDISSTWRVSDSGTISGEWAIATDRQIYYQNDIDCDNHENFAFNVDHRLHRSFSCHVPVASCLDNRQTWSFSDMESAADRDFWDVNVLVTFGVQDYDGEEIPRLGCWLENSLQVTEELYDRRPAMRIRLQTRHVTEVDGQSLSQMIFASEADYRRFMEEHFDIVAPSDTSGYFQIVVTDDLKIGDKDIGGRATFPHAVEPFSRKYGIVLEPSVRDDTVLAHEFGHYLGLKHTFEPYGITTNPCNRDYDANWLLMEERHCRSCQSGMDLENDTCAGAYNVMDYCENPTPPQQVYVNDCQELRAANTRDRYMNGDGRTRYDRMKGAQ